MRSQKSVRGVIWKTVKKEKWLSLGIVFAVIGAIVTALLPPLILGNIIDTITNRNKIIYINVILYFTLLVLTGVMESLREGLLIQFGQKITHALRGSLMDKFTNLTADVLTKQEPGAVVSRFVGDVDTVENLFTSGIISMAADTCKIISILTVIWFRNKGLAFVLLVLLPVLFWFTRVVQKNMLAAQIKNRQAVGRASGHVPETLHNIRTIHNLDKEAYMTRQYDKYIEESYRAVERTNFYDAIYSPIILILNAVVVAAVMLFSASGNTEVLRIFGMSAGIAVAVMNYISQIFTPVESLGMEIQTIQSAFAGVYRINEFFGLEELPHITKQTEKSNNIEKSNNTEKTNKSEKTDKFEQKQQMEQNEQTEKKILVEFLDVTFAYDDYNIFENLSFQVKEGEQVTLSGRTGAGKSTIFKLLLGLYSPKHGNVRIGGKNASTIPDSERRKLFGYVEQSFHMVPGTVKDQITLYDKSFTMDEVREAAAIAGLDEAIENLDEGYDTVCTQGIFSQGQWQLLSIARAAVAKPKLLLLDEITANLDAQTEKEVLQALKRVSTGRTVISISHRVNAETGRLIKLGS